MTKNIIISIFCGVKKMGVIKFLAFKFFVLVIFFAFISLAIIGISLLSDWIESLKSKNGQRPKKSNNVI